MEKHSSNSRSYHINHCIITTPHFYDHYFLIINDLYEYHPGVYRKGNILPFNTTKGHHIYKTQYLCEECFQYTLTFYKSLKVNSLLLYPMTNCETLVEGSSGSAAIALVGLTMLITNTVITTNILLFLFILVCALLIWVLWSRYKFSRHYKVYCEHLII